MVIFDRIEFGLNFQVCLTSHPPGLHMTTRAEKTTWNIQDLYFWPQVFMVIRIDILRVMGSCIQNNYCVISSCNVFIVIIIAQFHHIELRNVCVISNSMIWSWELMSLLKLNSWSRTKKIFSVLFWLNSP